MNIALNKSLNVLFGLSIIHPFIVKCALFTELKDESKLDDIAVGKLGWYEKKQSEKEQKTETVVVEETATEKSE